MKAIIQDLDLLILYIMIILILPGVIFDFANKTEDYIIFCLSPTTDHSILVW